MVCMRLNLTVGMSEQNTVEELTHLLRVTTEVNRVGLGDCVTRNSLVTDCGGLLREKKLSIQKSVSDEIALLCEEASSGRISYPDCK